MRSRSEGAPGASNSKRAAARTDVVTEDYRDILTELALLTTVSVLLFGFLLTTVRGDPSGTEQWLSAIALISVASATSVFILPVAYHRLHFPYSDWDKFQIRSHGFISVGFPLLGAGLYLSLTLALWDLLGVGAFLVAVIPVAVAALLFVTRRSIS